MQYTTLFGLAAAVASAAAQQGFNFGANAPDGTPYSQDDFEALFSAAQGLAGTNGEFTSARLYTMIQAGTSTTPISAIPAAIDTQTSLLLGLWASAGQANFDNELIALQSAIEQYGSDFTDLVEGISIGSEDLYRNSPTGRLNNENPGIGADALVRYIEQARDALADTPLSSAGIGHVDTWTVWVDAEGARVIDVVDWVGFDGYPYFETTEQNSIDNAQNLFYEAYNKTVGAAGEKPVWITESGWPVSGDEQNLAVASTENAERYWQDVACQVLGNIPTWWYTLRPTTLNPDFGILSEDFSAGPRYNLSCSARDNEETSSSSSSRSSTRTTATAQSATAPNSAATSGTVSLDVGPGPIGAPGSGYAAPTGAPYPSGNGTAGSSAYYPTGNGAGAGSPASPTSNGGSGESGVPEQTGAASKAGSAAGAGVLALFGLAMAL